MIELNGKYANAYIYASIVDEATYGQIIKVINNPVALGSRLAIMADCHAGAGCVIGTTMLIKDRVCPNLVGVDIGCGMLTIKLGKLDFTEEEFKRFDEVCRKVPSGFVIHKNVPYDLWNDIDPAKFLKNLKCFSSLKEIERIECSMGTLGGGNHFIELDIDENDNYYLVIHSGSRNLGKQVCEYYQNIAIKSMCEKRDDDNHINVIGELAYLEGEEMNDYINDLRICQEYASLNRKMIAYQILLDFFNLNKISSFSGDSFKYAASKNNKYYSNKGELRLFETIHNYIDLDKMILRKGAVSASLDEILLIPINMRDGSLICRGLGNKDYNYSAPHGAGRIMSRGEAKSLISLDEYIDSMKNVHTSSVGLSTIDEAPFAYKPIETILDNIKDTVEVLNVIKPIYNFKASGE